MNRSGCNNGEVIRPGYNGGKQNKLLSKLQHFFLRRFYYSSWVYKTILINKATAEKPFWQWTSCYGNEKLSSLQLPWTLHQALVHLLHLHQPPTIKKNTPVTHKLQRIPKLADQSQVVILVTKN